jgi:hypothetical protein
VDVLRLFAGELQQRARPVIVLVQLRAGVVDDERQDELFDQPEDVEIGMAANLVERALLFWREERQRLYLRANDSGMNGFLKSSAFVAAIRCGRNNCVPFFFSSV